jgi:hypothetical protein
MSVSRIEVAPAPAHQVLLPLDVRREETQQRGGVADSAADTPIAA